jgi:hypothetical protein
MRYAGDLHTQPTQAVELVVRNASGFFGITGGAFLGDTSFFVSPFSTSKDGFLAVGRGGGFFGTSGTTGKISPSGGDPFRSNDGFVEGGNLVGNGGGFLGMTTKSPVESGVRVGVAGEAGWAGVMSDKLECRGTGGGGRLEVLGPLKGEVTTGTGTRVGTGGGGLRVVGTAFAFRMASSSVGAREGRGDPV